jgi:hypothetical protein
VHVIRRCFLTTSKISTQVPVNGSPSKPS